MSARHYAKLNADRRRRALLPKSVEDFRQALEQLPAARPRAVGGLVVVKRTRWVNGSLLARYEVGPESESLTLEDAAKRLADKAAGGTK